FDIPTTLSASKHAIEAAFSPRFLSDKRNLVRIERREISNFEKTLRLVLPPNERLMSVSVAIRPLEPLQGHQPAKRSDVPQRRTVLGCPDRAPRLRSWPVAGCRTAARRRRASRTARRSGAHCAGCSGGRSAIREPVARPSSGCV